MTLFKWYIKNFFGQTRLALKHAAGVIPATLTFDRGYDARCDAEISEFVSNRDVCHP